MQTSKDECLVQKATDSQKSSKKSKTEIECESATARTTKYMAFLLMGLFSLSLFGVLIAAIFEDPINRVWFDLFKNGFLFLGGALTTVIGYYFGSRGIQEAEMKEREALKELEILRTQQKIAEEQRLSPTSEEMPLQGEEEIK